MIPLSDFHTHTEADSIDQTVAAAAAQGLAALGVTDHLNYEDKPLEDVPRNFGALRSGRQYISDNAMPLNVYFGVEVHLMDRSGLHPLTDAVIEEFRFDYTLGGLHGLYDCTSLDELARVYHQLHLKILQDPGIDVFAHPYKISLPMFAKRNLPPFEDFRHIPGSQVDEIIHAARENGKALEVPAVVFESHPKYCQSFQEAYRKEFLPRLVEGGVMLVLGSDCHGVSGMGKTRLCRDVLRELGLDGDRIWMPRTCLGPASRSQPVQ